MRRELLELVRRLLEDEEPFARATVVRRRSPTSSRLGDSAVITRDGELYGWIGGSCTTPTVVRQALEAIEEGAPRLVAFGFGEAGDEEGDVVRIPMTCQSGGSVEVYIEPEIPAPRLLVVGASPISRALVRIGGAMGWSTTVVAPGQAGARREVREEDGTAAPDDGAGADRDVESPAELADHNVESPAEFADRDVESLAELADRLRQRPASSRLLALVATMGRADEKTVEQLLELGPDYLGVIASPRRMAQIRSRLGERGVDDGMLARVHGPAGLDLGGETPEEIAVSVLAEMVTVLRTSATAGDGAGHTPAAGPGVGDDDPPAAGGDVPAGTPPDSHDPTTRRHKGPPGAPAGGGRRRARTGSRKKTRWATDPVCGMSVEKGAGHPTAEHRGRTWTFCCEGCRDTFLADPDAHVEAGAAGAGS